MTKTDKLIQVLKIINIEFKDSGAVKTFGKRVYIDNFLMEETAAKIAQAHGWKHAGSLIKFEIEGSPYAVNLETVKETLKDLEALNKFTPLKHTFLKGDKLTTIKTVCNKYKLTY